MVVVIFARDWLRHEARKRGERDEEEVQHRAGAERTVPEGVNERRKDRHQDEEHRRRKGEDRNRTRRQLLCLLEPQVADHVPPLADDGPDQKNGDRRQTAEADKPVLHQELKMVVVDVGAADGLQVLRVNLQLLHLGNAQMRITPAAAAEELMVLPERRRHIDMVLRLARDAVEHRRVVKGVDLALDLLRHGNRREEDDEPEDHETPDADEHPPGLAHPRQDDDQRVREVDDRRHRHEDDCRAGEGVQRGEEEDGRRQEEVVEPPEASEAVGVLRALGRTLRQVFAIVLLAYVTPERDGEAEQGREVIARHVRIAEGREEVHPLPVRQCAPERTHGARRALDEPQDRQRRAVPDDELENQSLAATGQPVADREDGRDDDHEPHDGVVVAQPAHAGRQERARRLGADARGNLRRIATGAESVIDERHEEKRHEDQRDLDEPAPLEIVPQPLARIVSRLVVMPLREADENLHHERAKPRHDRQEQIAPRAAEHPRHDRGRHGDRDRGNVIVKKRHTPPPFAPRPLR